MYLPDSDATAQMWNLINCTQFRGMNAISAVKQLCGISRFMVGTSEAISFYCSIRAFTQLELMRAEELIEKVRVQSVPSGG